MKLLLIEDDKALAETLHHQLAVNYIVDVAMTAKSGQTYALTQPYDLIILDLGLPDGNGVDICHAVRGQGISTPILILTGQFATEQKIAAFDAGADQFISKPFSFNELTSRIRSLLRRPYTTQNDGTITLSDISLNPYTRDVTRQGQNIHLRRKEFELLEYLMRHPGRVVTRAMIQDSIWGLDKETLSNAVDVHIKMLRDKLDRPFSTKVIQTVHGVGYKLAVPAQAKINH